MIDFISKGEVGKFQLFAALAAPVGQAKIQILGLEFTSIVSVAKEDGSGQRFIVTGYTKAGRFLTCYVETLD